MKERALGPSLEFRVDSLEFRVSLESLQFTVYSFSPITDNRLWLTAYCLISANDNDNENENVNGNLNERQKLSTLN